MTHVEKAETNTAELFAELPKMDAVRRVIDVGHLTPLDIKGNQQQLVGSYKPKKVKDASTETPAAAGVKEERADIVKEAPAENGSKKEVKEKMEKETDENAESKEEVKTPKKRGRKPAATGKVKAATPSTNDRVKKATKYADDPASDGSKNGVVKKKSPAKRGRKPKTKKPKSSEDKEEREETRINIVEAQEQNQKTYDKRRKKATEYRIGDRVAIKRRQFGVGHKLRPRIFGPYAIVRVRQNDRCDVRKVGSHERPNLTSSAVDLMKKWTNQN